MHPELRSTNHSTTPPPTLFKQFRSSTIETDSYFQIRIEILKFEEAKTPAFLENLPDSFLHKPLCAMLVLR
jgi:hypothetical protein